MGLKSAVDNQERVMMVRVRYTLIRYVFIQRTKTVLVISDLSHVTLPIDVWMSWIEKKFFKIKQKQINDHQVSIISHLSRTKIYRFVSLGLTHCLDLDLNGLLTRRNFWRIPGFSCMGKKVPFRQFFQNFQKLPKWHFITYAWKSKNF